MRDTEPVAKKRGTETISDMVRSMGILLIVVVIAYLLARAPSSDDTPVRVVPTGAAVVAARQLSGSTVLVADGLPAGWRSTSAYVRPNDGSPVTRLHVGWVTPSEHYAELEQVTGETQTFLDDLVGGTKPTGSITLGGHRYDVYRHDGDTTLARTTADGLVLAVDGDAPDAELTTLVQALRPATGPLPSVRAVPAG